MQKLVSALMPLFLLCTLFTRAFAEGAEENSGLIKGTITTADGQPAAAVTVKLPALKKIATTDDDGVFTMRNIPAGNYTIEISLVGYETITQQVDVSSKKTTPVSITLTLSQTQLQAVTVNTTRRSYVTEKPSESIRLNARLIEVPQNIAVTNQQTIKDLGALSTTDILRTASGVLAVGARQDIQMNIRGTQTSYSILRNGIGSGYWYNMEADAGMIDRVEFIKGPAGFMISNTEPGGLVNIVTKQPTHEKIAAANLGFGSWNMMRATIDLGGEVKPGSAVTYRLNAGIQQQADYYQFNFMKKYYVAAAIKYELDEKTAFTFEFNKTHGHQLSDGQYLPTVNGKFFALSSKLAIVDPNTPGTVSGDQYFRFHAKHALSDKWTLNAQASYITGPWGGYMMQMDGTPVTNDTIYRAAYMTDWVNKLFTVQAFIDGQFNTGANIDHKVLVGIDYGDNNTVSQGGGLWDGGHYPLDLKNPTYYLPVDTIKNFDTKQFQSIWGNKYSALYVQDHIKFFNKLVVTLAARYTSNITTENYTTPPTVTDTKITPRLGLTYLFNDNLSAYALYDEAFIPQTGRSFTNQSFKPLTGNNKEIGIKSYWFNKKLSINVSAYNITKNNALTKDPAHPDFSVQAGQLVSKGIEFDMNGNLTRNVNIMANYAYTDARITRDNDETLVGLANFGTPNHTANLFAKYRFLSGVMQGFSFGGGLQYVGKRNGVWAWNSSKGNQYAPEYTVLEATAGYAVKKFYVNLNVYNLANRNYVTYAYKISDIDWQYTPGEPLNFRLDFGIRF